MSDGLLPTTRSCPSRSRPPYPSLGWSLQEHLLCIRFQGSIDDAGTNSQLNFYLEGTSASYTLKCLSRHLRVCYRHDSVGRLFAHYVDESEYLYRILPFRRVIIGSSNSKRIPQPPCVPKYTYPYWSLSCLPSRVALWRLPLLALVYLELWEIRSTSEELTHAVKSALIGRTPVSALRMTFRRMTVPILRPQNSHARRIVASQATAEKWSSRLHRSLAVHQAASKYVICCSRVDAQ